MDCENPTGLTAEIRSTKYYLRVHTVVYANSQDFVYYDWTYLKSENIHRKVYRVVEISTGIENTGSYFTLEAAIKHADENEKVIASMRQFFDSVAPVLQQITNQ